MGVTPGLYNFKGKDYFSDDFRTMQKEAVATCYKILSLSLLRGWNTTRKDHMIRGGNGSTELGTHCKSLKRLPEE
jgi:hypothetical protein